MAIEDNTTALEAVLAAVEGMGNASFTNILCVGDSWSEGVNSLANTGDTTTYDEALTWPNIVAGLLGCEFAACREGGAGFVATGWRGNTFAALVESMATAADYGAGVIVGGVNDWETLAAEDYSTFAQGVLATCNAMYAKSNGKMTDIYWCMFWGPKGWGKQVPGAIAAVQVYMDAQELEYSFHAFPCWDAIMARGGNWTVGTQFDPLHPNAQGYRAVAHTVARYMRGMQAAYQYSDTGWATPFTIGDSMEKAAEITRDGVEWIVRVGGIPICNSGTRVVTCRLNTFYDAYGLNMTYEQGVYGLYGNDSVVDTFGAPGAYGYGLIRLVCKVSDPSGVLDV